MQQLILHMIQLDPGEQHDLPVIILLSHVSVQIFLRSCMLGEGKLSFFVLLAGKRLSAAAYLEQWGPRLFPPSFEAVLHPFFTALLPMDADERVAALLSSFPQFVPLLQQLQARTAAAKAEPSTNSRGNAVAEAKSRTVRDDSEGPASLERSVIDSAGVTGGLGTQLSSIAGPAMQVGLLL